MKQLYFILMAVVVTNFCISCSQADTKAPDVVKTFPETGSTDVDPSIKELIVTFDEKMQDGNWSWAYTDKSKFPKMTGQPYYKPGHKTNVLPVKLEPNKAYEIWINSQRFKNFKDLAGNAAIPFRLVFKTK